MTIEVQISNVGSGDDVHLMATCLPSHIGLFIEHDHLSNGESVNKHIWSGRFILLHESAISVEVLASISRLLEANG